MALQREAQPRSPLMSWRRTVLAGVIAAACAGNSSVDAVDAQKKTLKDVMHCDLKALAPVWSGAYIVRKSSSAVSGRGTEFIARALLRLMGSCRQGTLDQRAHIYNGAPDIGARRNSDLDANLRRQQSNRETLKILMASQPNCAAKRANEIDASAFQVVLLPSLVSVSKRRIAPKFRGFLHVFLARFPLDSTCAIIHTYT